MYVIFFYKLLFNFVFLQIMKPQICLWLIAVIPFVVNGEEQNETQKSLIDILPVFAETKALIQLLSGDKQGSDQTIKTYHNEGLIASQINSAIDLFSGNSARAAEKQKKFLKNLELIVDGIPVVGHVKGAGHILFGDNEHGWEAIKSATSSSGGVVGAVLGGPVGAIVGHALTDVTISGIESAITQEIKTYGLVDYAKNIGSASVGQHLDAATGMVLDVIGGKVAKNKKNHNTKTSLPKSDIELGQMSETQVHIPIRRGDISRENPNFEKIFQDENENTIRQQKYEEWYQQDEFLHEKDKSDAFQDSGELLHYKEPVNLNKLDLNILRNKLSYLSDNLRSQIKKKDFKTVNTMNNDHASCSIAGVLDIDVESLHSNLVEPHKLPNNMPSSSILFDSLNKMRELKYIEFSVTPTFEDLHGLNTYLKGDGKYLNSKPLIMELQNQDGSISHSVELKFKIVNDKPEILLIDYQKPGLKSPDLPNPDRFIPFIDTMYNKINLYSINIQKPLMLMKNRHVFRNTIIVSTSQ